MIGSLRSWTRTAAATSSKCFGTPLEIRIGAFRGRTVSALFKKYSQKERTKRVDTARVGAANPAKLSVFRKSEFLKQSPESRSAFDR
jgi:hypothetical protein